MFKTEQEKFWAGDFAGEIMDRYKNLELIDYGFLYNRDGWNDNSNWFLLKKVV